MIEPNNSNSMEEKTEKIYKRITVEEWLKSNPDEDKAHVVWDELNEPFAAWITDGVFEVADTKKPLYNVTHVLVETSIQNILEQRLPTKEDIDNNWPVVAGGGETNYNNIDYRIGARWLRDKLLKG